MNFQQITLVTATVILLLVLGFVAYTLYKAQSNMTWPPMISECPDYWTVTGISQCSNPKNLGSCGSSMDFSDKDWQGQSGLQKKFNWARQCGLTWDGVTNNPQFTSF